MLPAVAVLRLGHRPLRDQRVTTHVGLAARAFGAEGIFLAAEDAVLVQSLQDVVDRWGGDFFVQDKVKWKRCIQDWRRGGGSVVHLTMYGMPIQRILPDIRACERVLVVVGAEKVPGEVYGLADFNVSVSSQPHSEISALAVFLDRLFEGRELEREFPGAQICVEPSEKGKKTREVC